MAQAQGFPPPPPHVPQGPGGRITERASFGRRFLASLIDGLLLGAVSTVISMVMGTDAGFGRTNAAGSAIQFAIGLAYYIYLHGSPSGQTVGKKVLNIRVVGIDDGGPIGHGRAALRYVATFLSALPCGLGYLWMLWDKEKQTWHDKIANTIVVPEAAAPVAKWPG